MAQRIPKEKTPMTVAKLTKRFEKVRADKLELAKGKLESTIQAAEKTYRYEAKWWGGGEALSWFMEKNGITFEELVEVIDYIQDPVKKEKWIKDMEEAYNFSGTRITPW